jgi:hypothetical protein
MPSDSGYKSWAARGASDVGARVDPGDHHGLDPGGARRLPLAVDSRSNVAVADEMSDEEAARALAPLLEIKLRDGTVRRATANDVLELMAVGPPRYVLKDSSGRYIAADRKSWTDLQSEALIIPDRDVARATAKHGSKVSTVKTRAVRICRRGTCGIEGVRLRPDVEAKQGRSGAIELAMKPEDAMALLGVMRRAKDGEGVQ